MKRGNKNMITKNYKTQNIKIMNEYYQQFKVDEYKCD
jgi:hypothetical protein